MRVSTYTIVAPLEGERFHLLMNGLTGALDKVDQRTGQWIAEHKAASLTEIAPPISQSLSATLYKRGHLTDLSMEEERTLLIRVAAELHSSGVARAGVSFSFIPTYRCNLRCSYCFQSHDMHRGAGPYSSVISPSQIDHAFAIIDALWPPGSFFESIRRGEALIPSMGGPEVPELPTNRSIGLFGGEPLTRDTFDAVQHICAGARQRGLALSAITNGVELDAFEDLLGIGPGQLHELQITLDGDESTHNMRRIGPGRRDTFSAITDNIYRALERGVTVHVRMNVDRANRNAMSRLVAYFERRGWTERSNFDFHAAAVDGARARPQNLISRSELVDLTSQLYQDGHDCAVSYEPTAREFLLRTLGSDSYPFYGTANCSAETGQIMFDPLGDVYSCWEEVGQREDRVGTYSEEGLRLELGVIQRWLSRFPGAIDSCSVCPYALVHKSGCANHARADSGTMMAPDCKTFQEFFPATLASSYQEFERRILTDGTLSNPSAARRRRIPVVAR